MISKSDYMLFLRQPAWLWLKKNDPSKLPPVDAATQAMFDAGHAFEPYVESLFPEGVTLGFSDFYEYRSLPLRTQQAFESGARVVFQPRFEWNGFTCISDMVSVVDGRTVDLYEIKSSTRVKPDHLYDLAFQKTVLEGNGFTVRNVSVIHVNNQYVRMGDVNPKELTKFADVTDEVNEIAVKTPEYMEAAKKAAVLTEMPDPNPELAKLGSKSEWMKVYENIFPPEPKVWPEDTRAEINKQEIERFLGELQYPLYFFDYETMQGLVPYFDGQRPYQQVPFQYSLHIIREPGGEVEHKEYLHKEKTNPAPNLAKQLVEDMGDSGSIITWNMRFEKSVNEELGRMYPEYAEQIKAINERVVDLMIPFKSKWYDDPRCEGSASIKKVLPVVCPELSYKDLGIQNGATASIRWYDAVVGNVPEDQAKKIYQDLLKYCCLDTLAMVKIYEYLGQFTPAYEQYR
jgi:hypothetical protein